MMHSPSPEPRSNPHHHHPGPPRSPRAGGFFVPVHLLDSGANRSQAVSGGDRGRTRQEEVSNHAVVEARSLGMGIRKKGRGECGKRDHLKARYCGVCISRESFSLAPPARQCCSNKARNRAISASNCTMRRWNGLLCALLVRVTIRILALTQLSPSPSMWSTSSPGPGCNSKR